MPKGGKRIFTGGGAGAASTAPTGAATVVMGPDYGTTNQAVEEHLTMSSVTGVYPLIEEESLRPTTYTGSYQMQEELNIVYAPVFGFSQIEELSLRPTSFRGNYPMTEEESLRPTSVRANYPMTEEGHVGLSTLAASYRMTEELDIPSETLTARTTFQAEELSLKPTSFRGAYPMTEEESLRPTTFTGVYTATEELNVSQAEYFMSEIRCTKDAYADTNVGLLGTCADTANHGTTNLRILRHQDAISTVAVSSLVGFNLSGFPSGASVTSASLVLNRTSDGTSAAVADFWAIASASEGWAEATLVCSNMPADGPIASTQTITSGLGDKVIDVSTLATAIANRMGTAVTFSIKFRPSTVSTGIALTFASRETGTTALAPRLRLRFTVPV